MEGECMFDRVKKMSHIIICGNYGETNLRNMLLLNQIGASFIITAVR